MGGPVAGPGPGELLNLKTKEKHVAPAKRPMTSNLESQTPHRQAQQESSEIVIIQLEDEKQQVEDITEAIE